MNAHNMPADTDILSAGVYLPTARRSLGTLGSTRVACLALNIISRGALGNTPVTRLRKVLI